MDRTYFAIVRHTNYITGSRVVCAILKTFIADICESAIKFKFFLLKHQGRIITGILTAPSATKLKISSRLLLVVSSKHLDLVKI